MVEQIKKLCSQRNISIKALEKMLGFGNGTIRRWDTNTPSIERINLVASFFEVPLSAITGESDTKEKDPTVTGEVSEVKQKAWELLQTLDDNKIEKFLIFANEFLKGD